MSTPALNQEFGFAQRLSLIQQLPQLREDVVSMMCSADPASVSESFSPEQYKTAFQCLIDSQLMTQEMFIHFSVRCNQTYSSKLASSKSAKLTAFKDKVKEIHRDASTSLNYTTAIESLRRYCKSGYTTKRKFDAFFAALPVRELLQLSEAHAEVMQLNKTVRMLEAAVIPLERSLVSLNGEIQREQNSLQKLCHQKEKVAEIVRLKQEARKLYEKVFEKDVIDEIFEQLDGVTTFTQLKCFLESSKTKTLRKSGLLMMSATVDIESVRMACMMVRALNDNRDVFEENDCVMLDDKEKKLFTPRSQQPASSPWSIGLALYRSWRLVSRFVTRPKPNNTARNNDGSWRWKFARAIKPKKWTWRSFVATLPSRISRWWNRSSRHQQRQKSVTAIKSSMSENTPHTQLANSLEDKIQQSESSVSTIKIQFADQKRQRDSLRRQQDWGKELQSCYQSSTAVVGRDNGPRTFTTSRYNLFAFDESAKPPDAGVRRLAGDLFSAS